DVGRPGRVLRDGGPLLPLDPAGGRDLFHRPVRRLRPPHAGRAGAARADPGCFRRGPVKPRALLSWSSGKDSAWALHVLRRRADGEGGGLVTTFNEAAGRVAMHAVRRDLVEAQARAAGLPLWPVALPWPCTNAEYEHRMGELIGKARGEGITRFAFG